MAEASQPRFVALLGLQGARRLRMRRTLAAAGLIAFFFAFQWALARGGGANAVLAAWLAVLAWAGQAFFIVAIRSGWSERFADPSLTMPQMLFAMSFIAISFGTDLFPRGALLLIVALVLVFGAFALPRRRCRQLGITAVVLLVVGVIVGMLARLGHGLTPTDALELLSAFVVLPAIGYLAGELSQLRLDNKRRRNELRDAIERLESLALQDEMTGLPNRRHVQEWMVHERARHKRRGEAMCLAIIDLDHFKRVNDTYGHGVGDDVLRLFARESRHVLRDCDVLARWGGEEFLLVMPETHLSAGRQALARLRTHMSDPGRWSSLPTGCVSFSAGLALLSGGQTLDDCIKRADDALYEAKRAGRDRVVEALAA